MHRKSCLIPILKILTQCVLLVMGKKKFYFGKKTFSKPFTNVIVCFVMSAVKKTEVNVKRLQN